VFCSIPCGVDAKQRLSGGTRGVPRTRTRCSRRSAIRPIAAAALGARSDAWRSGRHCSPAAGSGGSGIPRPPRRRFRQEDRATRVAASRILSQRDPCRRLGRARRRVRRWSTYRRVSRRQHRRARRRPIPLLKQAADLRPPRQRPLQHRSLRQPRARQHHRRRLRLHRGPQRQRSSQRRRLRSRREPQRPKRRRR
jgi:hypothetical protein